METGSPLVCPQCVGTGFFCTVHGPGGCDPCPMCAPPVDDLADALNDPTIDLSLDEITGRD